MENRRKLFNKDSDFGKLTILVYNELMTRKPVTYGDIIEKFDGKKKDSNLKQTAWKHYHSLKIAFNTVKIEIKNKIKEKYGYDGVCIKEHKRGKEVTYTYIFEKDNNPLSEEIKEPKPNIPKELYRKICWACVCMAPKDLLSYLFEGQKISIDHFISKENKHILFTSANRIKQTHIDLFPNLYKYIENKKVLSFIYEPFDEPEKKITLHPYGLKEYNERWFLCGCHGCKDERMRVYPLDRIKSDSVRVKEDVTYIEPAENLCEDYFKDIIGVTKKKHDQKCEIILRAYSKYMFMLMKTKPLHQSQQVKIEYNDENKYGEFTIMIMPNNEFYGRILQMGENLEIISPEEVRNEIKKRTNEMAKRYNQ
ncbi:MAG: WYL domain-containing protein [Bacteroidaceae bacterium]|nr:WYL domain-containing protein [Bacteroidaceae bacterium]